MQLFLKQQKEKHFVHNFNNSILSLDHLLINLHTQQLYVVEHSSGVALMFLGSVHICRIDIVPAHNYNVLLLKVCVIRRLVNILHLPEVKSFTN